MGKVKKKIINRKEKREWEKDQEKRKVEKGKS